MSTSGPRTFRAARLGLLLGMLLAVAPLTSDGWLDGSAPALAAALPAEALLRAIEGGEAISTGRDGRLTVLLLGSDARGGGAGRMDTIMVVSLKGRSATAVSIPRDLARIPLPNGQTHRGRINELVATLARGRSLAHGLSEFKGVVEHLLGIEIDYYAMLKFKGFDALTEEIQPVPVRIGREIRDPGYWDDPNKPSGVYFPQSASHDLFAWQPGGGVPLCNGVYKSQSGAIKQEHWCKRAMPFVRSRKGGGNSDFARARRQQDFLQAAAQRVIGRGEGGALTSLLNRAKDQQGAGQLVTDIPLTAANALALYRDLKGASLDVQAVLRPPTYATAIAGSATYEPKVAAIRQAAQKWLGGQGGDLPAPSATPPSAPSPGPSSPGSPGPGPVPGSTAQPGWPQSTTAPDSTPSLAPTMSGPELTLALGATPGGVEPLPGVTQQPDLEPRPRATAVAVVPGPDEPAPTLGGDGVAAPPTTTPDGQQAPLGAAGPDPDPQLLLAAIGAGAMGLLFALLLIGRRTLRRILR